MNIATIVYQSIQNHSLRLRLDNAKETIEDAWIILKYFATRLSNDLYECMPHDVEHNVGGLVESEARVEVEHQVLVQYELNKTAFKRLGIKPSQTYKSMQPLSKEQIAIEATFHYVKGHAGHSGKSRRDIANYIIQGGLLGDMDEDTLVKTIQQAIQSLENTRKIQSNDGGQTYTFY